MQQKIAVGAVAVIVIALIGYFSTLVVKDLPILGNFVEGEHYTLLEKPRRIRGEKIEVMEFFSYGCIHCYNFDPDLTDWVEANSDWDHAVMIVTADHDHYLVLNDPQALARLVSERPIRSSSETSPSSSP